MREHKYDWVAIRAHYDSGYTREECQRKFGFSNGAWNRAVERGDIEPRPRSSGARAWEKREAVAALHAQGLSYSQIGARLGICKSTVAYHARRVGIPAAQGPARRYDWDAIQAAYDSGLSVRACAARFGFCLASWQAAVRRGAVTARPRSLPIEELLVVARTKTNRVHLKNRLIAEGHKQNRCERCGVTEWLGRPLSLEIHHKNGDPNDNRLSNLSILCPNCHSQTDTWGGRNGHRRPSDEPPG